MTTNPSTGTEIQEDAWNRGFDHVFDMGDWMHAVEIDPEYNDTMRLLMEHIEQIWGGKRADNPGESILDHFARVDSLEGLGVVMPEPEGDLDFYEGPICSICDGIHGSLCPIESPDPLYYEDEQRQGR